MWSIQTEKANPLIGGRTVAFTIIITIIIILSQGKFYWTLHQQNIQKHDLFTSLCKYQLCCNAMLHASFLNVDQTRTAAVFYFLSAIKFKLKQIYYVNRLVEMLNREVRS
jgi:hypothetical protein